MTDKPLTPKQERFAQVYVETSNASEAYRQAYDVQPDTMPKSIWETASQTLANPKVASRVMELQELHALRHNVTVDSITEELNEARVMAIAADKPETMISASNSKAKLHGLLTDKVDNTSSDGSMSPKPTVIELVGVEPKAGA